MGIFHELRRRNVFRVAIAYLVVAWLSLQVVDVVAPILALPDWVARAFLLLLVVGFPVALVIAWAFELTPDGLKRDSEVDHSQSIAPQTGSRLNRLIIVGMALIIVLLVVERTMFATRDSQVETPTAEDVDRSVAVLPFADLSEAGDQAWFADGLAEEILNVLARTPDLLVASRTSAFAYKNSDKPITDIGRELGVGHVLEGSVRRSGDRLRVTAQLIRSEDGFHVWSQNYDRQPEDVIQLQEDLAISIAQALETTMDPQALEAMLAAGTRSVMAYEKYLEGLALMSEYLDDADFNAKAQSYQAFEAARALDPNFSEAHAQTASIWAENISISNRGMNITGLVGNAETPGLAEMMGEFRLRMNMAIDTATRPIDQTRRKAQLAVVEMRLRDAASLLQTAVQELPNDPDSIEQLATVAIYLSDRALLQEASDYLWAHAEQDSRFALSYLQYPFRIGGQPPDREQFVQRIISLMQRFPYSGTAYQAQRSLLWMGETEQAARMLPLMEGVEEGREIVLARQACAEGRRADAEAALASIDPARSEYDQASSAWHILMLLGRNKEAYERLRPYENIASPLTLGGYLTYPHFDPSNYPMMMDIIERESIDRPPPVPLPFACPPNKADQQSIAVLPFDNLSSDPEQEYFADGLTEEILNALAQLPELLVTARTSSFYFKDRDEPVGDIAELLGVAHILEGSVRRAGDQVRITAQLVRAEDGFHLWSQSYDATLDDVFQVQDDISQKVAQALDVLLDSNKRALMAQAGVRNPEAYALFARGFELHRMGHTDLPQIPTLIEAREYFNQATELAPEMWAAWFTNADLQSHIMDFQATGTLPENTDADLVRNAPTEHARLLRLASRYAPNEAARDFIEQTRRLFSDDWTGMGELVRRSYGHTQACGYDMWLHLLGANYGNARLAYEFNRRGTRCNAVDVSYWSHAGLAAIYDQRPDLALRMAEEGLSRVESTALLEQLRGFSLLMQGDVAGARARLLRLQAGSAEHVMLEAMIAANQGDAETLARLRTHVDNMDVSRVRLFPLQLAALAGDRQAANAIAADIDRHPAGPMALASASFFCFCGAPFDLEATPNFQARFEETGLNWPPAQPYEMPLKHW